MDLAEFSRRGGKASRAKLTPEQRVASAKKAIAARWKKYYEKKAEAAKEVKS